MRIIELGGREVRIKGSPMTPYFYKKAFGQSLSGDLMAMEGVEEDRSKFDDVNILQMIWAMEKTVDRNIKPFEKWLEDFEYLNLDDVLADVVEEAMNATFRDKQKQKPDE